MDASPPGTPTSLSLHVQPAGARVGAPIPIAPVVEIVDADGRLVRDTPLLVSVTVTEGIRISGTRTVTTEGGRAAFNDLVLEGPVKEYTLEFTAEGLKPGRSKSSVLLPPARSMSDRPDDVTGAQLHVVYVLPAGGSDRGMDTTTELAYSVAAAQNWLANQLGGRAFRLDTYRGALDVTFFRLARTSSEMEATDPFIRREIQEELRQAGRLKQNKLYLIYYDGSSRYSCGGAGWPPHINGPVAALYLRGAVPGHPTCGSIKMVKSPTEFPGYWEFAGLHELFHTMGGVQKNAPNHQGSHPAHVPEQNDLMYSGRSPWVLDRTTRIDVGADDYFGSEVPTGVNNLVDNPHFTRVAPVVYNESPGPMLSRSGTSVSYPPMEPAFDLLLQAETSRN